MNRFVIASFGTCLFAVVLLLQNAIPSHNNMSESQFQKEAPISPRLIHVNVTDNGGSPIIDLQKEDFTVYENGIPQGITEFEKHFIIPSSTEPQYFQKIAPQAPLMNRKIFFIFDFAFSDETGFQLAKKSVLNFIESYVLPMDEISVFSFSGQKVLKLREYRTNDQARVHAAIEALGLQDLGHAFPKEENHKKKIAKKFIVNDETVWMSFSEPPEVVAARNFFWAMASFAESMQYVPGKKSLILLSSGIPGDIIKRANKMDGDIHLEYFQLCKQLAASNITAYSIYTGRVTDRLEAQTGIAALRELAETTGGRFLGPATDSVNQLNELQTLIGTYYVLGYKSKLGLVGKFHKIAINVARPDCVVRTQSGYYDLKPFSEYSDLQRQLHLMDLALAEQPLSQTPERFIMRAFAYDTTPPNNLGLIAEFSLDKLKDIVGQKMEVINMVFNGADDIVDWRRSESDFTYYEKKKAYFDGFLSVPYGTYRCRIVLRNRLTGRAAVAATTVSIPMQKADELLIYPPVLFLPDENAIYIDNIITSKSKKKSGAVDLLKELLVDPTHFVPVFDKSFKRNTEIWAAVRCSCSRAGAAGPKLSAFLVDRYLGRELLVPIEVINEEQRGKKKSFFIKMKVPDAEPDTYLFNLVVTESGNPNPSSISTSIIIE
jgi:VWFA-related protein